MHLLKSLVSQNLKVLFDYGEVEMVSNYDIIFAILQILNVLLQTVCTAFALQTLLSSYHLLQHYNSPRHQYINQ